MSATLKVRCAFSHFSLCGCTWYLGCTFCTAQSLRKTNLFAMAVHVVENTFSLAFHPTPHQGVLRFSANWHLRCSGCSSFDTVATCQALSWGEKNSTARTSRKCTLCFVLLCGPSCLPRNDKAPVQSSMNLQYLSAILKDLTSNYWTTLSKSWATLISGVCGGLHQKVRSELLVCFTLACTAQHVHVPAASFRLIIEVLLGDFMAPFVVSHAAMAHSV